MLEKEALEELDQLKESLEQIRENYTVRWTGSSRLKAREELFHFHMTKLQEEEGKIKEVEQKLSEKQEQAIKNETDTKENKTATSNMEKEIDDIRKAEQELVESKNLLKKEFDCLMEEVNTKQEELAALQDVVSTKREHLKKALQFFEKRLGLQIKKNEEGNLDFIFTHVDEKDWKREFMFTVKVDDDNKYIVLKCKPSIEALGVFTAELNETNNFSSFVIKIRTSFKHMSTNNENNTEKTKGIYQEESVVAEQVLEELTNRISSIAT